MGLSTSSSRAETLATPPMTFGVSVKVPAGGDSDMSTVSEHPSRLHCFSSLLQPQQQQDEEELRKNIHDNDNYDSDNNDNDTRTDRKRRFNVSDEDDIVTNSSKSVKESIGNGVSSIENRMNNNNNNKNNNKNKNNNINYSFDSVHTEKPATIINYSPRKHRSKTKMKKHVRNTDEVSNKKRTIHSEETMHSNGDRETHTWDGVNETRYFYFPSPNFSVQSSIEISSSPQCSTERRKETLQDAEKKSSRDLKRPSPSLAPSSHTPVNTDKSACVQKKPSALSSRSKHGHEKGMTSLHGSMGSGDSTKRSFCGSLTEKQQEVLSHTSSALIRRHTPPQLRRHASPLWEIKRRPKEDCLHTDMSRDGSSTATKANQNGSIQSTEIDARRGRNEEEDDVVSSSLESGRGRFNQLPPTMDSLLKVEEHKHSCDDSSTNKSKENSVHDGDNDNNNKNNNSDLQWRLSNAVKFTNEERPHKYSEPGSLQPPLRPLAEVKVSSPSSLLNISPILPIRSVNSDPLSSPVFSSVQCTSIDFLSQYASSSSSFSESLETLAAVNARKPRRVTYLPTNDVKKPAGSVVNEINRETQTSLGDDGTSSAPTARKPTTNKPPIVCTSQGAATSLDSLSSSLYPDPSFSSLALENTMDGTTTVEHDVVKRTVVNSNTSVDKKGKQINCSPCSNTGGSNSGTTNIPKLAALPRPRPLCIADTWFADDDDNHTFPFSSVRKPQPLPPPPAPLSPASNITPNIARRFELKETLTNNNVDDEEEEGEDEDEEDLLEGFYPDAYRCRKPRSSKNKVSFLLTEYDKESSGESTAEDGRKPNVICIAKPIMFTPHNKTVVNQRSALAMSRRTSSWKTGTTITDPPLSSGNSKGEEKGEKRKRNNQQSERSTTVATDCSRRLRKIYCSTSTKYAPDSRKIYRPVANTFGMRRRKVGVSSLSVGENVNDDDDDDDDEGNVCEFYDYNWKWRR